MEDKKSIFRQKSLDRISSPEELDQYLKVMKPGTWIMLSAVVILLIGFITWGFFGRLTTKINVAVSVEDGRAICYIPELNVKHFDSCEILIGEKSYELVDTGLAKILVDNETPANVKECGHLNNGDVVYPYVVDGNLANGFYQGEIVIEQVTPMHFIIN